MYEIVSPTRRGCKMLFLVPGARLARGITRALNAMYRPYVNREADFDYVRYGVGW